MLTDTYLKNYRTKNSLLIAIIFVFFVFLGSIINSYLNYTMNRDILYQNIDKTLKNNALNVDLLLSKDFHERAHLKNSISPEEDTLNTLSLSRLTNNTEIEYIYSMIQIEGEIFFTSSSATNKELAKNDVTAYFDLYDEATPLLTTLLQKNEIAYEESEDKWGVFRTIFIPMKSKNGSPYILGADIKIDFIETTLDTYMQKILISQSITLFLLIVLTFFFIKISRVETQALKRTLDNVIKKQTQELEKLNTSLEARVQEELEKNRLQDQQMLQQSRLALMSELISMIAHQWRQPLTTINAITFDLQMRITLGNTELSSAEIVETESAYFTERLTTVNSLVQTLSHTIDDFRNFYKSNKESSLVKPRDLIKRSLKIIKASYENKKIKVIEEYGDNEQEVECYSNELMQVILNVLKNAQDVLEEHQVETPTVKISTDEKSISICDNGGGISQEIIEQIFDPYFSTKDEKNGTGLGLYMSKTIVEEHHKGILLAKNSEDGACFIIDLS